MPKLSKVQKKVAKKRTDVSSLNENSRDAIKLRRAAARADKLEKRSVARNKAKSPHVQRIVFFKGVASAEEGAVDVERMQDLVASYIGRSDAEVAELKAQRRPGRPSSTREEMLKQRIAMEGDEYNSGYWMPDMRDVKNMDQLRSWNKDWASLGNITFIRLARSGTIQQSSFPPKGQS